MATVLIVDDEQDVCEHLCALLSKHGHRVVSAGDAAQALSMFDAHRPELVVTDIIMPEADGFAFIRQLRARPCGADARVIVYTAAIVNPQMRALARACGVELILEKPCTSIGILEAVEESLRSAPRPVAVPAELDQEHLRVLANQLAEKVLELEKELRRRKQAEEALRESEAKFRLLAESIHDVFWISTPAIDRMVYVSPAYEDIWGRTCASLYQEPRSFIEAIHPEDRDRVIANFQKLGHTPWQIEYRIFRTDGSLRWILDRGFPVRNERGEVMVSCGVAKDITERRQAQEAIHQANQRMRALARRILEIQEAERRHLARELHDEIGQVLSAVSVNLKIVKTKVDPSVWPRLEESALIVDHAVEQVRNLSLDLRPSVLDDFGLESALRWCLERLSERTGLYVHLSAEPSPVELSADVRSACFRVAQEALTNVVRHACAGEVWVFLQPSDTEVRLTIRDDGKGFDVEAAYRQASQGSSLGLLGMKERIELLGGAIELESAPGRGTSVHVRLPLAMTGEKASEAS